MIRGLPSTYVSLGIAGLAFLGYVLIRNEKNLLKRKEELEVQLRTRKILIQR